MKALIRVAQKFHPYSQDFQGERLQACVPNMEGRKMVKTSKGFRATNTPVPAFRKPYLILEGSDNCTSDSDIERFKQRLSWEGFTEFEFLKSDAELRAQAVASAEVQRLVAQATGLVVEDAPF